MTWQALSNVLLVFFVGAVPFGVAAWWGLRGIDDDCGWDVEARDELDGLERIHGGER